MSGSAENAYRITVSAQVKDNSGGTAYAFAVPAGAIPSDAQILQKVKSNQLVPETHMFQLGTFGPLFTTLTGNVESFVNWADLSVANQALLNYDADTSAGVYDVYIYAIDAFKNRAVQKHPLSPIQMTSDTITIAEVTNLADMFINLIDDNTNQFAEHRNLTVADPTLTTAKSLFDFHNGRTDALYLMEPALNESEFVVDTVKVVALAATTGSLQSVADFVNNNENVGTLVESFGTGTETKLEKVFDSVSDATGRPLLIGETYNVYSVIHNEGLKKDHVHLMATVPAGETPVITDATALITEI